jgi:hypothetical protein
MSCWRCGKELPEGQTECEPHCAQPSVDRSIEDAIANELPVIISFTFLPDTQKISTPGGKMMFNRAVHEWMMSIARSFSSTGLNQFCKPPDEGGGE